MKACSCRNFDCSEAKQAIEEHKPKRPEDIHKLVRDTEPGCGSCLPRLKAMIDEFNETGKVPHPLDLSSATLAKVESDLAARFEKETQGGDESLFKKRFLVRARHLKDKGITP